MLNIVKETERQGLTFKVYVWNTATEGRLIDDYLEIDAALRKELDLHRSPPIIENIVRLRRDPDLWVDMYGIVHSTTLSLTGHSLKAIAAHVGFDDYGNLTNALGSLAEYPRAVAGNSTARQRIRAYNRADLEAMVAIRDWFDQHSPEPIPEPHHAANDALEP